MKWESLPEQLRKDLIQWPELRTRLDTSYYFGRGHTDGELLGWMESYTDAYCFAMDRLYDLYEVAGRSPDTARSVVNDSATTDAVAKYFRDLFGT